MIELGARDLISAIALGSKTILKIKLYAFGPARRRDLAAEFWHERRVQFFADPQTIERSHAEGEERFADVKSWKLLALEYNHAPPGFREQRRRRASRRPTANDRDVVDVDLVHLVIKLAKFRLLATPPNRT